MKFAGGPNPPPSLHEASRFMTTAAGQLAEGCGGAGGERRGMWWSIEGALRERGESREWSEGRFEDWNAADGGILSAGKERNGGTGEMVGRETREELDRE
jgi:hypothetical protein